MLCEVGMCCRPPHCPHTAPILPTHCPHTAHTLSTHCPHSAHTLPTHCPHTAHTLSTHCPHTAHTLSTHCPRTAHTLPTHCLVPALPACVQVCLDTRENALQVLHWVARFVYVRSCVHVGGEYAMVWRECMHAHIQVRVHAVSVRVHVHVMWSMRGVLGNMMVMWSLGGGYAGSMPCRPWGGYVGSMTARLLRHTLMCHTVSTLLLCGTLWLLLCGTLCCPTLAVLSHIH